MEFKEAFAKLEQSLAQKIAQSNPNPAATPDEMNQHAFNLHVQTFEACYNAVPQLDLAELALFLGKAFALGGVEFMKPGHSPQEIETSLNELCEVFKGALMGLAMTMYGAREDSIRQQSQQTAQGDAGRVVDLSKLRGKV